MYYYGGVTAHSLCCKYISNAGMTTNIEDCLFVSEHVLEARYDHEFIPQPQVKEAQGGL